MPYGLSCTPSAFQSAVRDLQKCITLANFSRRFIRDFSTVATPLTINQPRRHLIISSQLSLQNLFYAILMIKPIHSWNKCFWTQSWNCSVTELGKKPKNQPAVFFSQKLSPAEQYYDIGNLELLVKQALEEWRHWLHALIPPRVKKHEIRHFVPHALGSLKHHSKAKFDHLNVLLIQLLVKLN